MLAIRRVDFLSTTLVFTGVFSFVQFHFSPTFTKLLLPFRVFPSQLIAVETGSPMACDFIYLYLGTTIKVLIASHYS